MSETIHDAVRATLKALTAANGGTLPPGLQIRHGKDFGHEQPHIVRLVCHECGRTVQYWVLLENQLPELEGMVTRAVQAHACWQPKPPGGVATEDADAREHLVSLLALWFDLPEDSPEVQGPIDAFARDLATKQRNALASLDADHGGHPYHADLEGLIGLIDPDGWRS